MDTGRTWRVAAHCAPEGDPGYGWSAADICWADLEVGVFGVARGFSPEPTQFRTSLAVEAAAAAHDGFREGWARSVGPVEVRLKESFAAADVRVHATFRSQPGAAGDSAAQASRWEGTAELAVLAFGNGEVWLAHCGTCRIYRARDGRWEPHTRDHTLAHERPELVAVPEARRIVTRRLGIAPFPGPALSHEPGEGALFLLCTPGIAAMLEARPSLQAHSDPAQSLAAALAEPLLPGAPDAWRTLLIVG